MIKKLFTLSLVGALVLSCTQQPSKVPETKKVVVSEADQQLITKASAVFAQLPKGGDPESKIAQLGKKLYHESSISMNGKLSCNSCHNISTYGVDNLPTSPGHEGKLGGRNSPTTFNANIHIAQFWDGRAADLEAQAKGPVLNPIEMGMHSAADVEAKLQAIADYKPLFAEVFPEEAQPITFDNFAKAVAAYEKTLVTPAPFDTFLAGNADAITADQKKGLNLFIETGCIACHTGAGLGGNNFQKFGLVKGPYWEFTHSTSKDLGKGSLTGNETDNYIFKTPSLRNIQKTAPYFHDGSVNNLDEAVKLMAYLQLGKELNQEEVGKIVTFLQCLTGEIPAHAL